MVRRPARGDQRGGHGEEASRSRVDPERRPVLAEEEGEEADPIGGELGRAAGRGGTAGRGRRDV